MYQFKAGKEQPNIQYAAALGNDHDIDIIETKYNSNIYDFIQKLPGINSKNIDGFLRQCKNLDNVVNMSEVKKLFISKKLLNIPFFPG